MSTLVCPKGIAFLGNFVPRLCGISTFTHDLYQAVDAAATGADCYVAAVTDTPEGYDYPEAVRLQFQEKDLRAYRRTADILNFKNADVLCVQHEFGIYGGPAGSYLLSLLKEVRMPVVTTLHTILESTILGAADIYVTPYLDQSQITSGTLAYAFGSGKVVVSTPYWHAEELLADGRGALVPFRDSLAMAAAIGDLLDDPARMQRMRLQAHTEGRSMIWSAVAKQYLQSFAHACADRRAAPRTAVAAWTLEKRPRLLPSRQFKHIARMSDGTGIFQHAIFNVPNFHEGYCVDDNARAFILGVLMAEKEAAAPEPEVASLTAVYLAFLAASLDYASGRFRNFMSFQREWLEHAGSEDSHGRSLWATGLGAARATDSHHRKLAAQLFSAGLPVVESFSSPRAWAFAIIGIDQFLRYEPSNATALELLGRLTDRLKELWRAHSSESWPWFERSLTYENARLGEAMILSGQRNEDAEALDIGLKSLAWLASIQTIPQGCFRPIGSNGFYPQNGPRADFDQQPVEAQSMVAACRVAWRATQDRRWLDESKRAFEWFLGRNDLGLPLYDFASGGCADGLHADRLSHNQGAESTLAFHLSLTDMHDAELDMSHAAQ